MKIKNKDRRLRAICEIIRTQRIRCQSELMTALGKMGLSVTQATLSRDLKTLRMTKIATETGDYIYIIPNSNEVRDSILNADRGPSNPNNAIGFVSLSFSGNIAVLKTRNGYASGLAYDIDMSRRPEILGTIAGADTIIIVLKEGVSHADAENALRRFIPADSEPTLTI